MKYFCERALFKNDVLREVGKATKTEPYLELYQTSMREFLDLFDQINN